MMELTREIAYAASRDAGNRRMRRAGRSKWSRGDYNAAVREFNRLWPEPFGPAPITGDDMLWAKRVIAERSHV